MDLYIDVKDLGDKIECITSRREVKILPRPSKEVNSLKELIPIYGIIERGNNVMINRACFGTELNSHRDSLLVCYNVAAISISILAGLAKHYGIENILK